MSTRNERLMVELVALLQREGLTNSEFGREIGVSRQNVYAWVTGKSGIGAKALDAIRRKYVNFGKQTVNK